MLCVVCVCVMCPGSGYMLDVLKNKFIIIYVFIMYTHIPWYVLRTIRIL
jgi:hypothetical protein